MADNRSTDPSGSTTQFKAYAQRPEPELPKRSPAPIIAGIVIAVVVVAVVLWLVLK